jgi:hypothetical protein
MKSRVQSTCSSHSLRIVLSNVSRCDSLTEELVVAAFAGDARNVPVTPAKTIIARISETDNRRVIAIRIRHTSNTSPACNLTPSVSPSGGVARAKPRRPAPWSERRTYSVKPL